MRLVLLRMARRSGRWTRDQGDRERAHAGWPAREAALWSLAPGSGTASMLRRDQALLRRGERARPPACRTSPLPRRSPRRGRHPSPQTPKGSHQEPSRREDAKGRPCISSMSSRPGTRSRRRRTSTMRRTEAMRTGLSPFRRLALPSPACSSLPLPCSAAPSGCSATPYTTSRTSAPASPSSSGCESPSVRRPSPTPTAGTGPRTWPGSAWRSSSG